MFQIALCDDHLQICSEIEQIILDYKIKTNSEIEATVFYSGEELIKWIDDGHTCDLLFLDIELMEINGLEVGRRIRKEYSMESMHIVFISGKPKYHHNVFKIRPMDFIDKPFKKEEIIECLEYAMKLSGKKSGSYTYKYNRETYKIPVKNILYIESKDKEIYIISTDKTRKQYGKLREVYEELEKYDFIFAHRSYIVNLSHVTIFSKGKLVMSNNDIVPISRSNQENINNILNGGYGE